MDLRLGNADVFYRSGLTETVSTPRGSFPAFLDVAEPDPFTARISTHTLRFLSSNELAANDLLTIAAATYKVIGQPRQINRDENTADLVRQ